MIFLVHELGELKASAKSKLTEPGLQNKAAASPVTPFVSRESGSRGDIFDRRGTNRPVIVAGDR